MNDVYKVVKNLPDNPKEKITWVCYNKHMKKSAENLISLIKGEEYLANVEIVTREEMSKISSRMIYYSPDLFDMEGNGHNV